MTATLICFFVPNVAVSIRYGCFGVTLEDARSSKVR